MSTAEDRAAARIARREEAAARRIAAREAAAQRRQDAYAQRVMDRRVREAERRIQRAVLKQVAKRHTSTRIPTQPIPVPRSRRDQVLTKLLGSANPTPVQTGPKAQRKLTKATHRTHAPKPGTRRVKTRNGWITIQLSKKRAAVTHKMMKSRNRLKRALGELLRR